MENLLDDCFWLLTPLNKSDKKAVEFRKIGNIKYQQKKLALALIDYNKSIAFANSKEVVALGYSNRSAVYFEFERYEDCLKNIEWAFENNYPEEKKANLMKRKARCEELMEWSERSEDLEDLWDFFKLSYPPNKKIPWIVDCVTLRVNSQGKQGIFATRDLKAGDIISIEEPFAPIITDDAFYGRCCNCSKTEFMNLIPCNRSASIMFCSISCEKEFHGKAADLSRIRSPIYRTYSELVHLADGKENLENIIENSNWEDPKVKKTIFDYDWSDPNDPNYKENLLKCFLSLQTTYFKTNSDPSNLDPSNLAIRYFGCSKKVLKIIAAIVRSNLMEFRFSDGDVIPIFEYVTVPLFASLLNRVCSMNSATKIADNKIVTFIILPVKKNEEIVTGHEPIRDIHKFATCQMCLAKPDFDRLAHILVELRDFLGLEKWMENALKIINNSPVQQTLWDRYPATYVQVMRELAEFCSYPRK